MYKRKKRIEKKRIEWEGIIDAQLHQHIHTNRFEQLKFLYKWKKKKTKTERYVVFVVFFSSVSSFLFPPLIHNLMCAVQCNRPNHTEQRRNRDWITIPPNAIQSLIILLLSLYVRSPLTHSLLFVRSKCITYSNRERRTSPRNER